MIWGIRAYHSFLVSFAMAFVAHSDMQAMTTENTPVSVVYCSICSLPKDYCKYGPSWDKHPEASGSEDQSAAAKVAAPVVASKPAASGGAVIVKIAPRVGRRYLTTISGLEQFDVELGKACKVFAKKFACGVGKGDNGEIEIQGDVEESIVATITSNWSNIRSKHITIKRKEK
jgi:translation initiation factor 1 (eIF-1/SUI1)